MENEIKEPGKMWKVLESTYLYKDNWLTARKDHVLLPNGNHVFIFLNIQRGSVSLPLQKTGSSFLSVNIATAYKRCVMNFVPVFVTRRMLLLWTPLNGNCTKKRDTGMAIGWNI